MILPLNLKAAMKRNAADGLFTKPSKLVSKIQIVLTIG